MTVLWLMLPVREPEPGDAAGCQIPPDTGNLKGIKQDTGGTA